MIRLLTLGIRFEHDVVIARQKAREAAELLGFGVQDQTRIATAASELARNAFRDAGGGRVELGVEVARPQLPARLVVRVSDEGPGAWAVPGLEDRTRRVGRGWGLEGARRLMDTFEIASGGDGETMVTASRNLPAERAFEAEDAEGIRRKLHSRDPRDPFEEIQRQNDELVEAMRALREREEERDRLLEAEREARERAQAAVQARQDLLSIVSHDLRNPIGAIITGSTFLLESPELLDDRDVVLRQLGAIQRSSQTANRLIQDLLDLASIETGQLSIEPEETSVLEVLDSLRDLMDPPARERELDLRIEPAEDITVWADPGRIVQVLGNLVGNAIKFTPRGGSVRVRTDPAGDRVRFSVADTGPGIPPDQRDLLFDRFWRADRNGTAGTGLGLAIVKAIVEGHGGAVEVESEVGRGSTFRFTVPRERPAASGSPEPVE